MEVSPLPRRERERLARRRAMLDAALAVFAEKGYEGATLDEVAERAEFGKGTLYNYFPGGKESILFALFDEVYDNFVALVETYFAEADADQPVRAVFHGFIEAALRHLIERQNAFMLIVKEAHRMAFDDERENVAYFLGQRERVVEALATPLRAAQAADALRAVDAHGVAHMLMGNIHGYLMVACSPYEEAPVPPSPAHGADLLTTILFDGLLTEQARA